MKKLRLTVEELQVQSFVTTPAGAVAPGTVHGREGTANGCYTGDPLAATCVDYQCAASGGTCDASCNGSCGCPSAGCGGSAGCATGGWCDATVGCPLTGNGDTDFHCPNGASADGFCFGTAFFASGAIC